MFFRSSRPKTGLEPRDPPDNAVVLVLRPKAIQIGRAELKQLVGEAIDRMEVPHPLALEEQDVLQIVLWCRTEHSFTFNPK
jgi:hypothetical protein